ncbi:serine protease inhibitor Cvsi-2-like [Crassostrea angulata]|uniref:serine protease inhibitor Cvsi-2-like n=1 Tax=Magallana angulata TaxID=2784310 RepID=UPI0022B176C0|nr:serine protease inhibitor Cvsi-2-like [Crassostrea angulata]
MSILSLCVIILSVLSVLQAESCTNGTDCHEVQCFDDFYVACELGTCTCGGHGTVGCSSNEDCTNDPLLHCPSHHKHCRDTKCYCVHGNHGHGK